MNGIRVVKEMENPPSEHAKLTCKRKLRHRCAADGIKEAIRLRDEKEVKDLLTVYRCACCKGYHVGRATKTILARLRIVQPAP